MAGPTEQLLIGKGYLHDHSIPPLTTAVLANILGSLPVPANDPLYEPRKSSRCVTQSVPKRRNSRRLLSIPNPLHQIPLVKKLVEFWPSIEAHCAESALSLTTPTVDASGRRAVVGKASMSEQPRERALRGSGARFHLTTDFTRYYASIYTHSLAWALHGKDPARADAKQNKNDVGNQLPGNQLDTYVRTTQDRQSVGLPVGPDTSLILSELIGTTIDIALQNAGHIGGLRYVDDFHLYVRSQEQAEQALAHLHGAARRFELDTNDAKTHITPMPDSVEPVWKIQLRRHDLRDKSAHVQANDLVSLFSLAVDLANLNPSEGVLKYAVLKSKGVKVKDENWPLYESFLLRSAIAEPSCLPDVLNEFESYRAQVNVDGQKLAALLNELCRYHAPLQHGFEVALALWFAIRFGVRLDHSLSAVIGAVDDDCVALTALHARNVGILDPDVIFWQTWLSLDQLNLEHWLAAYEISQKGWLTPTGGADYIGQHPFFDRLRANGVVFYDDTFVPSGAEQVALIEGYA